MNDFTLFNISVWLFNKTMAAYLSSESEVHMFFCSVVVWSKASQIFIIYLFTAPN